MPTYSKTLTAGNNDLNVATPAWPKGVRIITSVRLVGGVAASTVNIYDSAVSPPAVTHAATVDITQGPKVSAYAKFRYRPTPIAETAVPEFDPSVVLVPPGSAPAEPTGLTSTDASNYQSSTGVFQRNQYIGSNFTSAAVTANTAVVPSQGSFYVPATGSATFGTAISLTRGLVVNASAIVDIVITYE